MSNYNIYFSPTGGTKRVADILANELGNNGIVVNFLVEEQSNQPMFLTSDEKFKHMQEINPDFKRLKSELGLEII